MGLFSLFSKSNDYYLSGSLMNKKHLWADDLYKKILDRLGIRFNLFNEGVFSGFEVSEAGYENEFRKIARRNFNFFKENEVERLIVSSPESYLAFLRIYPGALFDWHVSVLGIWGIILRELQRKPHLIKEPAMEEVCFHDNCSLGRGCEIYEEPRRILEVLGYDIVEFEDNRENSFCCGSCGGLVKANDELANKIAKERLLQAKRLGIKKMIVCSIDNYDLLKKNSEDVGVEVVELSEAIADALEIKKEDYTYDEDIIGEEEVLDDSLRDEIKEEDFYEEGIDDDRL